MRRVCLIIYIHIDGKGITMLPSRQILLPSRLSAEHANPAQNTCPKWILIAAFFHDYCISLRIHPEKSIEWNFSSFPVAALNGIVLLNTECSNEGFWPPVRMFHKTASLINMAYLIFLHFKIRSKVLFRLYHHLLVKLCLLLQFGLCYSESQDIVSFLRETVRHETQCIHFYASHV